MARETNKKLKCVQPVDLDNAEVKLYSPTVVTWGLFAGIVAVSSLVGYMVSIHAVSIVSILELSACYCAVLAAAVIDLKTKIIPNYIPISLVSIRLLILLYELVCADGAIDYLIGSLIGGLLCILVLGIANKLSKGGIGGGDIKLLASVGFVTGIYVVLSSMLFALVGCAIISVILLILKKCSIKDILPFGPFIFAGYLIMCLLTLY